LAFRRILLALCDFMADNYKDDPLIDMKCLDSEDFEDYEATVVKFVDDKSIRKMVKNGEITTLEGLVGELRWISHNSHIFHGLFSEETQACLRFEKRVITEINRLLVTCHECFVNSSMKEKDPNRMLKPCSTPHLVVWGKVKGYPWWPGKVLGINGNDVNVQFFGDDTKAKISSSSCFIFSEEPPKTTSKGKRKISGKEFSAIQDANAYIDAMAEKFNVVFKLPNPTTLHELEEDAILKLFPEANMSDATPIKETNNY